MHENYFIKAFSDLEQVERELEKAGSDETVRQRCYDRLLELRRKMDRCVEYWLKFEEKLSELQEKHDFFLPDEVPDSLWNAFNEMGTENDELTAQQVEERIKTVNMPGLAQNEECIRSFRRALGFLGLTMMDEAIAEFRRVIALEPDLLLAHLCLGIACVERGMDDEAMRELRLVQALTKDPQALAISHNALGNIYASREQYDLALAEFQKAVELDPEYSAAYFNLGAAYYNLQEYEKTLDIFEKIKDRFPRDWELYFYLGKAYHRLGNDEEALVNLLKAAYLAPNDPYVAFELGLIYEKLGETRKALECYCRARKSYLELKRQAAPDS